MFHFLVLGCQKQTNKQKKIHLQDTYHYSNLKYWLFLSYIILKKRAFSLSYLHTYIYYPKNRNLFEDEIQCCCFSLPPCMKSVTSSFILRDKVTPCVNTFILYRAGLGINSLSISLNSKSKVKRQVNDKIIIRHTLLAKIQ